MVFGDGPFFLKLETKRDISEKNKIINNFRTDITMNEYFKMLGVVRAWIENISVLIFVFYKLLL